MRPTSTLPSGSSTDQVKAADELTALADVIASRRSIKQFAPLPVPRSLIERLIDVAVWAPNHRLTEPWRFYVLDGASRSRLGVIAAEITRAKVGAAGGSDPAVLKRKADEAAASWASVPVLIYVTVVTDPVPEVDRENYGAVCCAVQNLMLAGHAAGLGTSWSSGAVAGAAELHALAGADGQERMVGLIRVGYPAPEAAVSIRQRTPGATHTRWIDGT
ncbi:MAG: nitroreductase [Herpetosiphonaceae bacterium]|nr:nitroreductase [Herpetosiphonaceae bacterium]